ncbi:hypothetical protein L7F22_051624 [Adiantum nelumboides]|nr:hypothetical protein [Adiantum nelumboides]
MQDLSRIQTVLPRFANDQAVVLIEIKCKLEYGHAYLSGVVQPAFVLCALQELVQSPLYLENGATIDASWSSSFSLDCDIALSPNFDDFIDNLDSLETLIHGLYSAQQVVDHNAHAKSVSPCEGFTPLSLFNDEACEELSFPGLLFGKRRRYHSLAKQRYQKVAQWELKNLDRRFASDIENFFFKTMKIVITKVLGSIWVHLRKGKLRGQKLQAKDVQSTTIIENLLLSQVGYSDLESLRTSTDYKAKLKRNAFGMVRQPGPPTFFITFSCAEQRWKPLVDCLIKLNPHILQSDHSNTGAFIRTLVRSDPETTARYYVHRLKEIKTELKRDKHNLGKLIDYFFVIEFQQQGSQHDHGLLWIKDAPIFGVSLDDEIVDFIDSPITTNKDALEESLRSVQLHSHRKTCKKRKTLCRFGFP